MLHQLAILWLFGVLITSQIIKTPTKPQSDKEAAGFSGTVKTIEIKDGGFVEQGGAWVEQCCRVSYRLTYDIEGKCIESDSKIRPVDGAPSDPPSVEQQLNAKGQLIEELSFREDRSLRSKTIHKYDDNGNRVETARYLANGVLYHRETFSYTENRLREQIDFYGEDGSLMFRLNYLDYDSHGNWRKRVRSEWSTVGGDPHWRPFGVTYRSLTYY